MKKVIKKKRKVKWGNGIYNGVDSHNWANKMEIQRLISSKPDVKAVPKLSK